MAVRFGFPSSLRYFDWFTPPLTGLDPGAGRNPVLEWLVSYPPRHVTQAMLLMWRRLSRYPSQEPLGGRRSPFGSQSGNNMLIVAARNPPACRETISVLRIMLGILTDNNSSGVIPEAREPLSNALHIARSIAARWPGTQPLIADYLQSACTWEDYSSSRS